MSLYALLFELSRSRQNRLLHKQSPLAESIQTAIEQTPPLFPEKAAVACQGVEGSNSQIACERLFRLPNELYFSSFDAVFNAIEKGLCRYGVLPIENSTAGSVNAVYDLMMRHHFHIVRSVRGEDRPQPAREARREALRHPRDLFARAGAQPVRAVPLVASGRESHPVREYGARGKARCGVRAGRRSGALHARVRTAVRSGMSRPSVQDTANNYTRFICIARDLEIYPGADRTSLMMTLRHEPGSLYKVLSRFYALGINLNKLESRPLPERSFEFMFYFDLENPVYDPAFLQLVSELGTSARNTPILEAIVR